MRAKYIDPRERGAGRMGDNDTNRLLGDKAGAINGAMFALDPLGFLGMVAETAGEVALFDLGTRRHLLVSDAAETRRLLLTDPESLRKPEFLLASNRGHWGDGLTTLEEEDWHNRRALLRPLFAPQRIARHLDLVRVMARDSVRRWSASEQVDISDEMRVLVARASARFVYGAGVEGFDGPGLKLPLDEVLGAPFVSTMDGVGPKGLQMIRPRAPARMDAILEVTREKFLRPTPADDVVSYLSSARGPNGESLTLHQVENECIQMLYAGHHTMVESLVHLLEDLTQHHDLGERVRSEARTSSMEDGPRVPLRSTLCYRALQESMRLRTAAPVLYRVSAKDQRIGSTPVPRDTPVWFGIQLLHLNPAHYPDPQTFEPNRFLARPAGRPYYPFGAGPRTCIANNLSMEQMTIISLEVLRDHEHKMSTDSIMSFRALENRGSE